MITPSQYTRTFEQYQTYLRESAKRIAASTEARVWLNKNAAIDKETVEKALSCIGDLTGDYSALKIFRRKYA